MTRADEDALALRAMAAELGLAPAPTPMSGLTLDVDKAWAEDMLARVTHVPLEVDAGPSNEHGSGSVAVLASRHRRTPVAWLAAACAVVVVAFSGVVLSQPDPAAATPPILNFSAVDPAALTPDAGGSARDPLLDIARSARAQEAPGRSASATTQHVSSDQWRLEVEVARDDVTLTIRPTHDESWLMADGRVRYREVATAPEFAADGRQRQDGDVASEVVRDEIMPGDGRGALWPEQLPRDPAQLTALWLDGTSSAVVNPTSPTVILAGRITDLFGRWVVDPDLTATVWTALAARDDVRDLGAVVDRAGRTGRAFSVWDQQTQTLEVLIVDERTGMLLGDEGILFAYDGVQTDQQLPSPRIGFFTTLLSATWTNEG